MLFLEKLTLVKCQEVRLETNKGNLLYFIINIDYILNITDKTTPATPTNVPPPDDDNNSSFKKINDSFELSAESAIIVLLIFIYPSQGSI